MSTRPCFEVRTSLPCCIPPKRTACLRRQRRHGHGVLRIVPVARPPNVVGMAFVSREYSVAGKSPESCVGSIRYTLFVEMFESREAESGKRMRTSKRGKRWMIVESMGLKAMCKHHEGPAKGGLVSKEKMIDTARLPGDEKTAAIVHPSAWHLL